VGEIVNLVVRNRRRDPIRKLVTRKDWFKTLKPFGNRYYKLGSRALMEIRAGSRSSTIVTGGNMAHEVKDFGMEKGRRCAIYLRSASGDLESFEEQERSCRAAARQLNWIVLDDYVRKERGKFGTSSRELGVKTLIAEAEKSPQPFDCVLVDDMSRLSRNVGEALELIKDLECHGVGFYFAKEKLSSNDPQFRNQYSMVAKVDESDVDRLRKSNLVAVKVLQFKVSNPTRRAHMLLPSPYLRNVQRREKS
jgi:hypothetical protein